MTRFPKIVAALGFLAALALASGSLAQVPIVSSNLAFKNILDNPRLDLYPVGTAKVYTPSTISGTLTGLSTTPTYHAARFAVWGGTSQSVTVASVTSGVPAGFANSEALNRASGGSNTTQICMGQEIRSADVLAMAGQPVAFSVWAAAGSAFSAASSNMTFLIGTGTSTDEGLVTFLSGFAGAATAMSINVPVTTSFARYGATATIPATATEAVAAVCWTPVGTASGTNDKLTLTGFQLELGTVVSTFEQRPQAVELLKVLPYTQVWADGATTRTYGMCATTSSGTVALCTMPLLATMRAAPTTTVMTATSFGIIIPGGTQTACTTLAGLSTSNTTTSIGLSCGYSATSASGSANQFVGDNTGALLMASADF